MIADVEQAIREYLPCVIHLSLGTSRDNNPWVCEVHFGYDKALNFYFRSKPSTRHCQEIALNPRVAGNVIEPHGMTDNPRGVYFEGSAELLQSVDQNHAAYVAINERFDLGPAILEEAKNPDGHQFYKITVNKFYIFDTRESKPSQKYELVWKST